MSLEVGGKLGTRTTPQDKGVARNNPGSIQIVYDAELKDIPCCERIQLMLVCCSIYDKERSYLYLRENSIETNIAVSACFGFLKDVDFTNVTYFGIA